MQICICILLEKIIWQMCAVVCCSTLLTTGMSVEVLDISNVAYRKNPRLRNDLYCVEWDGTIPYHTIPYPTIPYHTIPYRKNSFFVCDYCIRCWVLPLFKDNAALIFCASFSFYFVHFVNCKNVACSVLLCEVIDFTKTVRAFIQNYHYSNQK